jgi:site-specific recombinase XerD
LVVRAGRRSRLSPLGPGHDHIDFAGRRIWSRPAVRANRAPVRALRKVRREQPAGLRHVFVSERRAVHSERVFQDAQPSCRQYRLGRRHPHLLRHACGFKLVNDGVDTRTLAAYLGHRQIANTARYTKMDARRFNGFWPD